MGEDGKIIPADAPIDEARKPCSSNADGVFGSHGVPYARSLPTIRAAVEGGYGAGYATLAEVGAGEMLMDRAVVRLLELMGKLQPVTQTGR